MLTPEEGFAQNRRSMDRRDHLDRAFPPEYAAVKQEVRDARTNIKEKNRRINALRSGAETINPELNMDGSGNLWSATEDEIRRLKFERNSIRQGAFEKAQIDTASAEPGKRQRMNDAAFRELQKGAAKRPVDRSEPVRLGADGRGMDKMQDHFYREAAKDRRANARRPNQNPPEAPQPENRALSMSARFSMTLGYSKNGASEKDAPAKQDPQQEASGKDQGKQSVSVRFSPSPGFDRAKDSAANPERDKSPDSPPKGKGKEDI